MRLWAFAGKRGLSDAYYYQTNALSVGATVVCFSHQGKLKWQFIPGKAVRTRVQAFKPPFFTSNVQVIPKTSKHPARIVVSSNHYLRYPDQVALLDASGHLVSEYWHSGHLLLLAHADIDGDGIDEILAGGLNNGHRSAILLILDPSNLRGAFVQPPGDPTQLLDFEPGTEKAAVLFPRTCIAQDAEFNRIADMRTVGNQIVVGVAEGVGIHDNPGLIVYELDHNLKVLNVVLTPKFKESHRRAEKAGLLDHTLSEYEEGEHFKRQVRVMRN